MCGTLLTLRGLAVFNRRPAVLIVRLFFLARRLCLSLAGQERLRFWLGWDRLRLPLILLVVWITSLIILASEQVYRRPGREVFRRAVLLLALILVARFSARALFFFYVLFEMALLPTLFLVLTWGYQPERIQAARYLLLYTVGASLPLLLRILRLAETNRSVSFFYQQ